MYQVHLQNRKTRINQLRGSADLRSKNLSPSEWASLSLFETSFLDAFKIEYSPKDFADIDWGPQKDLPGWERLFAS